jgi:glycosyltransferase involved in cell wall biosynthesis
MEQHQRWKEKGLLIRNGVDAERFRKAPGDGTNPISDQTNPIAGYVGAIEDWFDIAAVREAARANPQSRFVLAGRIESPEAERLRELPNVEMPGEVGYEKVPALLERFRVGLIPFRVNDLTRAADPIKLYEYFACGLPVVSSRLPEVEVHRDLVYLASTPAEFAEAVRAALGEDDPAKRERRRAVARKSSWTERARELYGLVAGL